uniref:Copper type II ascorbate-dependent monooxygenase C-terminal domain-containing protein n=1 Tax=Meloidogyne enterolobii TaxID=390850 RepID=A0A6V7X862_MELEN|nr:unnamed protein product [Meloidogyne enterolobii]
MCVNYIHYYPASEIEVCKSAVSNSSLHSFFSKLGVVDKRLSIQEKYLSIKWNTAKIGLLREFYHVSPLNVACLKHSGQLFKVEGHPNNWTRVLRPEYLEAPKSDSIYKSDECLAIND